MKYWRAWLFTTVSWPALQRGNPRAGQLWSAHSETDTGVWERGSLRQGDPVEIEKDRDYLLPGLWAVTAK